MKSKPISEVRISKLVTLRPGDKIRARGGPTYKGKRIGYPGVYVINRIYRRGGRIYADASAIDKTHGIASGEYVLFVQGKPFRSRVVETIVNRPYRVSKVRSR